MRSAAVLAALVGSAAAATTIVAPGCTTLATAAPVGTGSAPVYSNSTGSGTGSSGTGSTGTGSTGSGSGSSGSGNTPVAPSPSGTSAGTPQPANTIVAAGASQVGVSAGLAGVVAVAAWFL